MPAPAKQNLLLLQAITREAQNQAAKEGALVIGLPRGPRSCLPLEASSQGVCWRPEATLSCYFSYLNTVMFFSSLRRFPPFDAIKEHGRNGRQKDYSPNSVQLFCPPRIQNGCYLFCPSRTWFFKHFVVTQPYNTDLSEHSSSSPLLEVWVD